MSNQPVWQVIGTIGDVNPAQYGGGYVFVDLNGHYPAELEYYEPPSDDDHSRHPKGDLYRVILDRCEWYGPDLIPFGFFSDPAKNMSLPHPVGEYKEWFSDKLDDIAKSLGTTMVEYGSHFCSSNPLVLAQAYSDLAQYYGWIELDPYPSKLTISQAERRFEKYHNQLMKFNRWCLA